jgi:hypothetical protein
MRLRTMGLVVPGAWKDGRHSDGGHTEGAFALTLAEKVAGAPYAELGSGDVADVAAGEVVAAEEAGMQGSV